MAGGVARHRGRDDRHLVGCDPAGEADLMERHELREPPTSADTAELTPRTEEMRAQRPLARRRRARLPTAAWVCFAVALMNGIAWGLITPLFQVPDEAGHVAYAQYVAKTGKPPTGGQSLTHFSRQERELLNAIRWKAVMRRKEDRVPGTASFHKRVQRVVSTPASQLSEGGYTTDTNNPPLYYFAAAAVYHLSPWTSLADRVHAMRLLSALLAAVTVLFVFLFLRELLPTTPWAWTVGALAVAFQPMFGFTSSGVTSDTVLYTASAGIFYLFALSFRRGLTQRRGLAIGALTAVGVLAKLNMLGLAPGIGFGLLVLVLRADGDRRRQAIRGALTALAVAAIPAALYMAINSTVWDRGLWFGNSGVPPLSPIVPGKHHAATGGFLNAVSYMWQFYLPRLPSMHPFFHTYQVRQIWFNGLIGQFGWLDYGFPQWVYNWALALYFVLVALVGRELVSRWESLRSRLWELATYVVLTIGLLILVGATSYVARVGGAASYEQPRYLFPLLALYGALIALAARGAGKRYGPAVGVLLVCIAVAHTAASMLLTLSRYYG
jgi:4-amino-4-deoxy-L-arabinose transferase-like glycosyltransferase